jgi:hypothetical protein
MGLTIIYRTHGAKKKAAYQPYKVEETKVSESPFCEIVNCMQDTVCVGWWEDRPWQTWSYCI